MIEAGKFEDVRARIAQLDDKDMAKHVLELTLELTLFNEGDRSLDAAVEIYTKHFTEGGVELPMESISLSGHKAVGHLLSLQKKYDQSIQHFEYVGSKTKTEQ
jgi:hypothetical protein